MKRPVILHYHLFKNAGTSVDEVLKQNFKKDWADIEGPDRKKLSTEALVEFIRSRPNLKAVSSHTAVVALPDVDDLEIIPICFMRHPIDRIRSAYSFEKKQNVTTPGAIQAKKGSFQEYMDWRLANPPSWQVQNFHAMRFKDFHTLTPAKNVQLIEKRAKEAVENMSWLGLVEQFDKSLESFAVNIRKHFPDFKTFSVDTNKTSRPGASLQDNLSAFRENIGHSTYSKLEKLNEIDFQLYESVKRRFYLR